MTRYPSDLKITVEDFRRSGWKDAIGSIKRQGYWSLWQAFSAAATDAIEEGKVQEGKVLWLLADACSMKLNCSSVNEPFNAMLITHEGRSALPQDFAAEDVTVFAEAVEEVENVWLKARLCDLVWHLKRPRDSKFALMAIDAYIAIPLNIGSWVEDGSSSWDRAITLGKMLRSGAGSRITTIEAALIGTLKRATSKNGVIGLKVADLLEKHRLGEGREIELATKLEKLGKRIATNGNQGLARQFFDGAGKWFKRCADKEKTAEMVSAAAETFVKEAKARLSSPDPSNLVAARFYEQAILKLRHIPKAQRQALKVEQRIAKLYAKMTIANEKSVEEMELISSGPIDVSEIVKNSISRVEGKRVVEAFTEFASIDRGANRKEIKENSEKMLREGLVQTLFGATQVSRDGRVIGKRPPVGNGNIPDETLWAEMVKEYGIRLDLVTRSSIWPALRILQLEHTLTEDDFISLAESSPAVPPGRAKFFGKALFAGYDNDFVSALHLLVPQIENLVRFHLKNVGAKTTNIDINGIENENGLSTLADMPEMESVFGENLAFEIKAVYCTSCGPNLRNEIAHGLIEWDTCFSPYSVYAWWLGFRIIFNTYLNFQRRHESGKPSENQDRQPQEPASGQKD